MELKKTDWLLYSQYQVWNNLPEISATENQSLFANIYQRINIAANDAVPQFLQSKFLPKSWWTNELNMSKEQGLKKNLNFWLLPPNSMRREEVIINRFRSGHCLFLLQHLILVAAASNGCCSSTHPCNLLLLSGCNKVC